MKKFETEKNIYSLNIYSDVCMAKRKVTPEIVEEMKKLRKKGLPYGKIADVLKLSPMTVYSYLKKEEKIGFFEKLKRKFRLK